MNNVYIFLSTYTYLRTRKKNDYASLTETEGKNIMQRIETKTKNK